MGLKASFNLMVQPTPIFSWFSEKAQVACFFCLISVWNAEIKDMYRHALLGKGILTLLRYQPDKACLVR